MRADALARQSFISRCQSARQAVARNPTNCQPVEAGAGQTRETMNTIETQAPAAVDRHASYTFRRQARDLALTQCGIGRDIEIDLGSATAELTAAAADIGARALAQLHYDRLSNVPCLRSEKMSTEDLIAHGITSAWASLTHYDITAARLLAARLCEEVNDHELAAKLFALAGEGGEA